MNWISFPDLSILTRTILHKIVMQLQIRCVALYKIYVSEKLMIAQILPFCHSRNEFSDFATAFMNFSSNSWGCSEILRMRIKVQFFHEYLKNVDDRKTVNLRYCSWQKTCFFPQWTFWQIRFTSNWILYSQKERKNMKITIIGKCQHVIIITKKMCGRLCPESDCCWLCHRTYKYILERGDWGKIYSNFLLSTRFTVQH